MALTVIVSQSVIQSLPKSHSRAANKLDTDWPELGEAEEEETMAKVNANFWQTASFPPPN